MILLLFLMLSLVLMSFIEYVAHRWPMHNLPFVERLPFLWDTFETHALLHHGRYYKQFDKEPDLAARHISMTMDPFQHVFGLCPLWLLMGLVSWWWAGIFIGVVVSHAVLWTMVHREMHEPSHGWISRTWYFKLIREYHRTHHEHPGSNFNAVLPGMDWLFGTYRKPR